MTRLTSLCLFLFTILISAGYLLAQNGPNPESSEEDPCARFRMRVVKPPDDVDYKLRIAKPIEGIDYKLIVINPCKIPDNSRSGIKQNNLNTETGSQIAPALRFRFPSGGETKYTKIY
jgi:hypothetical protein